jgi:hypothetical protein
MRGEIETVACSRNRVESQKASSDTAKRVDRPPSRGFRRLASASVRQGYAMRATPHVHSSTTRLRKVVAIAPEPGGASQRAGGVLVGQPTGMLALFAVGRRGLWHSRSPARRVVTSADIGRGKVKAGHRPANGWALFTSVDKAHTFPVRQMTLLLLLLLPLAGCAGGPQALGITGPRDSSLGTTAAPPPGQDPLDSPNAFQSGTRYSPSTGPTTGSGRYWGYN